MSARRDALLAVPEGIVVWDAWMRKKEAEVDALEQERGHVFSDWSSMPAIEAEFGCVLEYQYGVNLTARALGILRWHGCAALSMVDYLLGTFANSRFEHLTELALRMLKAMHSEAALDRLLGMLSQAAARDAVFDHARRWPILVLKKLLDRKPNRNQPAAELVQRLLYERPEWLPVLREHCDATQLQTLERICDVDCSVEEASAEELPSILQRPPWTHRSDLPAVPELNLALRAQPPRFHWQGRDQNYQAPSLRSNLGWSHKALMVDARFDDFHAQHPRGAASWDQPRKALWMLGVVPERIEQAVSENRVEASWFQSPPQHKNLSHSEPLFLWHLPAPLAASVLQHCKYLNLGMSWDWDHRLGRLLRWLEGAMAPALHRYLSRPSRDSIHLYHCIEWDQLAPDLAHAACRNRWLKEQAWQWLGAYPETAARGLLPAALSVAGHERDIARQALRELAVRGHANALRRAGTGYGEAASAALSMLLATAPEQALPDVMPTLPKKLFLPTLPKVLLRESGRAVPLSNLPDLLICLALSRADSPYPGLEAVQAALTPSSLAQLGRALLAWWQDNDYPSKERWILAVQGLIGDDETARVLAAAIRQWRAKLVRVRAHDGMAMLAKIGSDAALMHLHSFAAQTRFRDLHDRANAMIDEIAEARGLNREQLADRSVPDLGLGEDGQLNLDFGQRKFSLHFDEGLMPFVRDETGRRLKDLPKSNSRDDAVLAKAAVQQYKDLKKQARSLSTLQIRRLESAMCSRRRWSAEEFASLLLKHPVMGHLCQRLLWGLYDAKGQLTGVVRVAEDRSLADRQDDAVCLPPTAELGIVHPLELDAEVAGDFGQVFSDYEILQPFEQLQRPVYTLSPELMAGNRLPEWSGRNVRLASLLGLEQRGWNRQVGDGGMIDSLIKPLGKDLSVAIYISGEWFVGAPAEGSQEQSIEHVVLLPSHGHSVDGQVRFSMLDPISLSELLRELNKMVWFVD